jgi:hypothetical protein
MIKGQAMYRSCGMQRSCVILDDAITTIQFMRLARESGISKYERYIDDVSAHRLAASGSELGQRRSRSPQ